MRRIGLAVVLSFGFALTAFTAERQQQAGTMYTGGRNLLIEQRFAEGRSDSRQNSAAQLVGLKVDALLTLGTPATLAAMQPPSRSLSS